ncbi:MAG: hypothetical protein AAGA65_23795 [Actinomycetota bacterium]
MNLKHCIACLVVLLTGVAPSESQVKKDEVEAEASQVARTDPTLTSAIQEPAPAVALLATEDGGKISGRAGWGFGAWDLAVVLEAPFDKDDPETNLANLDGLAGSTVGTFQLTREWVGDDWFTVDSSSGLLTGATQISAVCRDYNATVASAEQLEGADCRYSKLKDKGPRWALEALKAMPLSISFVGLSYSLSDSAFTFVDPETLVEGKATETNRSFGLSWWRYRQGFTFGVGYKRRETYKAGPKTELCQPLGENGALRCDDVQLGPPKKTEQDIASFDAKWQFNPSLALNVRLLYDLEEDLFNPHVLLFFLPTKDGSILNGGLDVSYDDDEEFTARLFVGTKFELFPD